MVMLRLSRTILASAALALVSAYPSIAQTQRGEIEDVVKDYLAKHPEAVEQIVKRYLIAEPDVLKDALSELIKRGRTASTHADKSAVVKANADLLFNSPHQVVVGNPTGKVTMVEFFDYNCGFCKRALSDTMTLLKGDPNLRIVLKEFPILGPGSVEAARVAIALRMQDPSGEKYLAFHQKVLRARGHADTARAMAAAREVGVDMIRLERDVTSEETQKTLNENIKLARALGISGTPAYVIGDAVIPGAVGAAVLKDKIRTIGTR
jgi:protein-disulfide isomerase